MMSSIKTTQVDGDVSVGRNVAIGGKANIAGSVRIGHNLKIDGWLEAPNIKGAIKGVFLDEQSLIAAYADPPDGWLAGVGASTPFNAYISNGGEWVATGGTIEVAIDTSQLPEEIEQLQEDLTELAERVETSETDLTELAERVETSETNLTELADAIPDVSGFATKTEMNTGLDSPVQLSYTTGKAVNLSSSPVNISGVNYSGAKFGIAEVAKGDVIICQVKEFTSAYGAWALLDADRNIIVRKRWESNGKELAVRYIVTQDNAKYFVCNASTSQAAGHVGHSLNDKIGDMNEIIDNYTVTV